jgi:CSLREA domain-containing protein
MSWQGSNFSMGRRRRNRTAADSRRRLRWERLEDRRLLAVATVTTLADTVDFNDGVTSLREAIFATNTVAGADTIEFDSALFAEGPKTILLTLGELVITDSLTINGPGAELLTIDASGNDPTPDSTLFDGDTTNDGDGTRVFLIDDAVIQNRFTAEVAGLTLTGGDTIDWRGGAIHSREHLTVRDCVITGNSVRGVVAGSSGGWGGGIQNLNGNLTVIGTTITNNGATASGGAIDFNSSGFNDVSMSIIDSTIENNRATSGGGVLVAGNTSIVGTTIANNVATSRGGGISVWDSAKQAAVSIQNSSVSGNMAGEGGAFYSNTSATTLEIVDSAINGNIAQNGSTMVVIRWQVSGSTVPGVEVLRVLRSSIDSNESTNGGVIRVGGGLNGSATIRSSSISGNTRTSSFSDDSAIAAGLGRLEIHDSEIISNGGDAIRLSYDGATLSQLVVTNTRITGNAQGLYARKATIELTDVVISGNAGHGIEALQGSLTVTGSDISDNGEAGVVSLNGPVDVRNSTINHNDNSGIDARYGHLTVVHCTISGNTNENMNGDRGSGIYHVGTDVNLVVADSVITGNRGVDGGGIAKRGSGQLTISDCIITENVATFDGGGVSFVDDRATISDTIIEGNVARRGGGVAVGELTLLRSSVSRNVANDVGSNGGGGIEVRRSLTAIDCSISNNATNGTGGGIRGGIGIYLENCNILGNLSVGPGGGVFSTMASVVHSTIANNRTTGSNGSGGGLAGNATVVGSTISGNVTEGMNAPGGGIRGAVTLRKSTVVNNKVMNATSLGGGISMPQSGITTLESSIVADNFAGGGNPDLGLSGLLVSSHTLVGDTNGMSAMHLAALNTGAGNLQNQSPLLGPLAYNGGPTFTDGTRLMTHALLAGSPAIDAVVPIGGGSPPVAVYQFEEPTGSEIAEDLLGVNDGYYFNRPALEQDSALPQLGNAVGFDGVDDLVAIPRSVSGSFSFSLWVKTSQNEAVVGLIDGNLTGSSEDIWLRLSNGRPEFKVKTFVGIVDVLVNDGDWHHLVATRDMTTNRVKVFVDGVRRDSFSSGPTGSLGGAGTELHLGGLGGGTGNLAGLMDEVRIYDRALTDAEIEQLAFDARTMFDQRGEPFLRLADGDGVGEVRMDMGAYERQPGEVLQLVVDTLEDELDGDYSAGDFSLREAIAIANLNPGSDTISFAEELWADVPATIYLEQGELAITDAVTIDGPGSELLTIDAQQQSRIFNITSTVGDYDIGRMTLTRGRTVGYTTPGTNTFCGGAIRSLTDGVLTLDDVGLIENDTTGFKSSGGAVFAHADVMLRACIVTRCTTSGMGANGGAIAVAGDLTIDRSIFTENSVGGSVSSGGAIFVLGSLFVSKSVFTKNAALASGAPGGGVMASGEITIIGSSIFENRGMGVYQGSGEQVRVASSTISGNDGLGIFGTGNVQVSDSTISGNAGGVQASGGIALVRSVVTGNHSLSDRGGGGLYSSRSNIAISNSIVAGNTAIGRGPDMRVSGGWISATFSLVGDNSDSGLLEAPVGSPDVNGNLVGGQVNGLIDPKLGPLSYNGGPTFLDGSQMLTHALLPGSVAIDAGDDAAVAGIGDVPEFDQRGTPWLRIAGGRIDMGAVEVQANPLPGDYNFDGIVDAIDYTVWRNTVGSADDLRADGSGEVEGLPDGVVDAFDYAWWKANYGNVLVAEAASGSGGLAAVAMMEGEIAAELRSADGGERSSPAIAPRAMLRFDLSATVAPQSRSADVAIRPTLSATTLQEDALLAWLTSRHDERRVDGDGDDTLDREVDGEDATADAASDDAFAALTCKF